MRDSRIPNIGPKVNININFNDKGVNVENGNHDRDGAKVKFCKIYIGYTKLFDFIFFHF